MHMTYSEFRDHMVTDWSAKLKDDIGLSPLLVTVTGSDEELGVILDNLLESFTPGMIHVLPVDLVRIYLLGIRNQVDVLTMTQAILMATISQDAMQMITRIRNSLPRVVH